jgi:hypothetical protein
MTFPIVAVRGILTFDHKIVLRNLNPVYLLFGKKKVCTFRQDEGGPTDKACGLME